MTLETRTCICGCKRTFRVLPTSPQKLASMFCDPQKNGWMEQRDRSKNREPIPPGRMSVAALAQELGISAATVYAWAKARKIPSKRLGPKGLFFDIAEVRRALNKSPTSQ